MSKNKYIFEFCEYSNNFIARMHELNKQAIAAECDTVDITYIKKGLAFAKYYHGQQMRKSGEPYVSHPIIVSEMVANYIFKNDVLVAALLHDTVEDTTLTLSEIEAEFGERVAQMVERLTRFVDPDTGKKITAEEKIRVVKKYYDKETVSIKFCDRIDNIKTLHLLNKEKANKILKESILMFCYWGLEFDLLNLSNYGYLTCKEVQSKINNTEIQNNHIPDFSKVFSNILSSSF